MYIHMYIYVYILNFCDSAPELVQIAIKKESRALYVYICIYIYMCLHICTFIFTCTHTFYNTCIQHTNLMQIYTYIYLYVLGLRLRTCRHCQATKGQSISLLSSDVSVSSKVAMSCSKLQCVLQSVAVTCSVLRFVAV